jgi:hypothetical protein
MSIELKPGDRVRRVELHEKYGGRRQGGISPSRGSDNVFLITAPSGRAYGYIYDGRGDDGYFHYTGEGQVGDQQMTQGNRAIRDHETDDPPRELHLFEAHGTELEYVGQFRYHDDYQADAPGLGSSDDGQDELRKVIVFRLEQVDGTDAGPSRARLDRFGHEPVKEVPIEQFLTEKMLVEGDREPYEAERREQQLVRSLASHLEQQGHDVARLQFLPEGEAAPLFCDLYDKTANTLYEAKSTVTRHAMRMAIGQLADYCRLVDPAPTKTVLMPEPPRTDLLHLAASQNIAVLWPAADGRFLSDRHA